MIFVGKVNRNMIIFQSFMSQISNHFVFKKLIIGLDKEMRFVDGKTFRRKKICATTSHFPLRLLFI